MLPLFLKVRLSLVFTKDLGNLEVFISKQVVYLSLCCATLCETNKPNKTFNLFPNATRFVTDVEQCCQKICSYQCD